MFQRRKKRKIKNNGYIQIVLSLVAGVKNYIKEYLLNIS